MFTIFRRRNVSSSRLFLGFPYECQQYRGPHYQSCVATIWREIGCVEEGWKHPTNLTADQWGVLNNMDLRLAILLHQKNCWSISRLIRDIKIIESFKCYILRHVLSLILQSYLALIKRN